MSFLPAILPEASGRGHIPRTASLTTGSTHYALHSPYCRLFPRGSPLGPNLYEGTVYFVHSWIRPARRVICWVDAEWYSEEMNSWVTTTCFCLQDCLRLFSKEEKLTDNNRFYCSHCRTRRDSLKKIEIWKLPPVLLVHLKR